MRNPLSISFDLHQVSIKKRSQELAINTSGEKIKRGGQFGIGKGGGFTGRQLE